ncbi:HAD hydrolase-like protein [Candidatus Thiosymbion oneisti]|uniref:HAD hydrolase-like protein n=1 Tax=Candidatus Thiosymbion oneisti TaxID=589554 RepID=UPI001A9CB75A
MCQKVTATLSIPQIKIAPEKMHPKGDCIWMIGDNPVTDIRGGREKISAVTCRRFMKAPLLVSTRRLQMPHSANLESSDG